MNNINIDLLKIEDIFGEERLELFDEYETKAAITDFAILLGGYVSSKNEKEELKDRTGWYYTKTPDKSGGVCVTNYYGHKSCTYASERYIGMRPILSNLSSLNIQISNEKDDSNRLEIEYGEYPQMVVNESISNILEELYNENKLIKTGKEYRIDNNRYNKYRKSFVERKLIEYEYNGEKYIRILGDYNSKGKTLSDGRNVEKEKAYFVKIEPIIWIFDKKRDIILSKKILFAGVQFGDTKKYKEDFENTRMNWFLNTCFKEDIIPSILKEPKKVEESSSKDEIVPYLVKYDTSEDTYGAYELNGILRDIVTSLKIVNKSKKDSLEYVSKKQTTLEVLKNYYIEDISKLEYLEYAKKISKLGKNDKLYDIYSNQIEAEEYKKKLLNNF